MNNLNPLYDKARLQIVTLKSVLITALAKKYDASWLKNGATVYRDEGGRFVAQDSKTGEKYNAEYLDRGAKLKGVMHGDGSTEIVAVPVTFPWERPNIKYLNDRQLTRALNDTREGNLPSAIEDRLMAVRETLSGTAKGMKEGFDAGVEAAKVPGLGPDGVAEALERQIEKDVDEFVKKEMLKGAEVAIGAATLSAAMFVKTKTGNAIESLKKGMANLELKAQDINPRYADEKVFNQDLIRNPVKTMKNLYKAIEAVDKEGVKGFDLDAFLAEYMEQKKAFQEAFDAAIEEQDSLSGKTKQMLNTIKDSMDINNLKSLSKKTQSAIKNTVFSEVEVG
jgi:hypothetical protein